MIGCVNNTNRGSEQVSRNSCFMVDYSLHVGEGKFKIINIISLLCRHVCDHAVTRINVSPYYSSFLTSNVIFCIYLTLVVILKVCGQRRKQSYCLNICVSLDFSHYMLHCMCYICRASVIEHLSLPWRSPTQASNYVNCGNDPHNC